MFNVLEEKVEGMNVVEIIEGDFAGCKLVYGKLEFGEEDSQGNVDLRFDYDIVNEFTVTKDQMPAFLDTIGGVLMQLIDEAISTTEIKNTIEEN